LAESRTEFDITAPGSGSRARRFVGDVVAT
jgi:hypothetical protein